MSVGIVLPLFLTHEASAFEEVDLPHQPFEPPVDRPEQSATGPVPPVGVPADPQ